MEERGDVRISFIHLVPETGKFIGIKVAGNESRLTGARRAGDPGHWILAAGIEDLIESLSRENPFRTRAGNLSYGNMPLIHTQSWFPVIFRVFMDRIPSMGGDQRFSGTCQNFAPRLNPKR